MQTEKVIQLMIYTHATLGGLALLSGGVALAVKKGSALHKKSGKFFFFSMLLSAVLAFFISLIPNHRSIFLFTIAVFTLYLILTGFRALHYKKAISVAAIDKYISFVMIATGITMIVFPIVTTGQPNTVLSVFGVMGLLMALRDLRNYRNIERLKKGWLKLHLGKMTGGYLASVTAFIVVNNLIPGIIGWLAPTIVGGFYIGYWLRKIK